MKDPSVSSGAVKVCARVYFLNACAMTSPSRRTYYVPTIYRVVSIAGESASKNSRRVAIRGIEPHDRPSGACELCSPSSLAQGIGSNAASAMLGDSFFVRNRPDP